MDEYEKLVIRMNTPRVVIDNGVCSSATIVKVDSARRHGILLEAVQILTDLNLSITKAYISSDGRWNMDVFHVTDINGNKLNDQSILSYIKRSIETVYYGQSIEVSGLTSLELTGTDRIGLLSEIFVVLSDLNCNVVDAKVWTHNGRFASIIYVKDYNSGCPIQDSERIARIEARLRYVLKDDKGDAGNVRTCVSVDLTHTERRLHQLMSEDWERRSLARSPVVVVTVQNWEQRSYSVVNVECIDRTKLLFDVVCTLTDMDYVVFHATINTDLDRAHLEFYIRHKDDSPISSEPARQRVIECLQAAVERRASKGVRLELRQPDRQGLLAEVMRTFRENGLNVTKTEISTSNDMAENIFYVTDANGDDADPKLIELVQAKIGFESLKVKERGSVDNNKKKEEEGEGQEQRKTVLGSPWSSVWRNIFNFGHVKSCS